MKRFLGIYLLLSFTVLQAPCSTPSSSPAPSQSPLNIHPNVITLHQGDRWDRIVVTFEQDGQLLKNIHPLPELTIDAPDILRQATSGGLEALAPGQATVSVSHQGNQAAMKVTVLPRPEDTRLTFKHDILPILSKTGCNAGSCHAKPRGQNGFKLSVFAYDPESDYRNIVTEARGRRIFPASPEASLILRKPTLAVPHEGGRRFDVGSPFHQTLVAWIRQGMTYEREDEAALKGIEIQPAEGRYSRGAHQALMVLARYSDGTTRDITHLAETTVTEKELATVDEDGTLNIGERTGEASVVARFMGKVDVAHITIPSPHSLPDSLYTTLPVHNFIDRLAYEHFQQLGLRPSETSTDSEFIRRSSLDALGRLPTPGEVREFLENPSPDKRNQWIDHLLQHPGYADHWAVKWGDLIRPNPFRVGVKGVYVLDQWLRQSFRENKPYDQFARDILTAQGSTHRFGPAVLFRDRRDPAERTTLISQIFLGTRLECARCHHHPNEKWSQKDFYQFAAYFGQVKRKGTGLSPPISGSAEFFYSGTSGQVKHPVTGEVMTPRPLQQTAGPASTGKPPREDLADWVTSPDNPYFARAIVNRIWAEYFGKGFVNPVDDFRVSNPPVMEAVLEALARDFVEHGYDLKHLMRTIMRSRLYQLSSLPNETNLKDTRHFSRSYRRRLPAEVMLDAVCDVTGRPETFEGLPPGSRAVETWNHRLASTFMDAFGRPNSSAECPCEREADGSIVQALHLMNSGALQDKLAHAKGTVAQLATSSRSEAEIIEELYLRAYARAPSAEELAIARKAFEGEKVTRQTATEDVLWALLNSAEFVFNH